VERSSAVSTWVRNGTTCPNEGHTFTPELTHRKSHIPRL
jgi:hypothetical protein